MKQPFLLRPSRRYAVAFLLLTGSVYACFWFLHVRYPYIREGARLIYDTKIDQALSAPLFSDDGKRHVLIFGNSKVLSGFIPDQFDTLSQDQISSYNLGLPDARQFIPLLKQLVAQGTIPSAILITQLWEPSEGKNPLVLIHDNKGVAERLFPFRYLLRDFAIFARRASYRGGFRQLYAESQANCVRVLEDRGYHFISSQSLHTDHRLPLLFRLPTDQPDRQQQRPLPPLPRDESGEELRDILRAHNIRAFVVPSYFRQGEWVPSDEVRPALREYFDALPEITLISKPAYFTYPPSLFSDPIHLNPDGATRYTQDLWNLLQPHLEPEP